MIGIVVDNVRSEEVLKEVEKYRFLIVVTLPGRNSNIYNELKKVRKADLMLRVYNKLENDMLETVLASVGRAFAEYKEPIEIWYEDKCVVY